MLFTCIRYKNLAMLFIKSKKISNYKESSACLYIYKLRSKSFIARLIDK